MIQESIHQNLNEYYKKAFFGKHKWFAVSGILLVLAGSVSLILPVLSDNELIITDGFILVFAGAVTLITLLSAPQQPGLELSLFGLLGVCAGVCLMRDPAISFLNPGLLFAAYFSSAGVATLLIARSYRCQPSEYSRWLMASGALSLNLAFISLSGLPAAFAWVFCIFLGLHFIFQGSALFAASLAVSD